MARKRYKTEEIVSKLRHVDVFTSQGHGVSDATRQMGLTRPMGRILTAYDLSL